MEMDCGEQDLDIINQEIFQHKDVIFINKYKIGD